MRHTYTAAAYQMCTQRACLRAPRCARCSRHNPPRCARPWHQRTSGCRCPTTPTAVSRARPRRARSCGGASTCRPMTTGSLWASCRASRVGAAGSGGLTLEALASLLPAAASLWQGVCVAASNDSHTCDFEPNRPEGRAPDQARGLALARPRRPVCAIGQRARPQGPGEPRRAAGVTKLRACALAGGLPGQRAGLQARSVLTRAVPTTPH